MSTSDEVKKCSLNALQKMEISSLQRKVDAAIIKSRLAHPFGTVNVEVTGKGKVHLTGLAYSRDNKKNIESVVKDVPGVLEVTSDISVMPDNVYD
jgi:osmotically-inducible protein OsmY